MCKPQRHARRSGVILMVVLALMTLFAIVGLTFVFYAQAQQTASLNFRRTNWPAENRKQAQSAAPVIQRDLIEALAGDLDFSASHRVLDGLAENTAIFQDLLCQAIRAEQDPRERSLLEELRKTLQRQADTITLLDWLIRQLEISPQESPA